MARLADAAFGAVAVTVWAPLAKAVRFCAARVQAFALTVVVPCRVPSIRMVTTVPLAKPEAVVA